jgi:hypothetical protein
VVRRDGNEVEPADHCSPLDHCSGPKNAWSPKGRSLRDCVRPNTNF